MTFAVRPFRRAGVLPSLLLLSAALALLSLLTGPGAGGWRELGGWLLGRGTAEADLVFGGLRLPRTLAGLLLGAGLACSGVLLQSVTRNPLAESGLLGVNSGAALAVAISLVAFDAQSMPAQLGWALGGAFAGCLLALAFAHARGGAASPLELILAGLALGATAQGLTAVLLLGDAAGLDQYRFWVLGSLARVTPEHLRAALPLLALGLSALPLLARPVSALGLGDDLARGLGFNPGLWRLAAVAAVAVLTGTAVALAGPLAFLGLVAPQLARGLGGAGVARQLAYAAPLGAAVLLAADLLARVVISPFEAPVSALLALIGAPALIAMVRRDAVLGLRTGDGPC